ncbi:MAG: hypothetical protein J7530_09670 [Novosphingobium sp.]|nr:hypothetical protein [Novosphingobium sp.]
MEQSLCIATLPLAIIAYFVQGKVASIKLVVLGGIAIMVSLGAAYAGTVMPFTRDLFAADAEMAVSGIAAIGIFGVLLAVPALSDIVLRRRKV